MARGFVHNGRGDRLRSENPVLRILSAIDASLCLLWHVTGLSGETSVFVYWAGLLAMIVASAAYNLAPHGPPKEILRRLDHSAIFIMRSEEHTSELQPRFGISY